MSTYTMRKSKFHFEIFAECCTKDQMAIKYTNIVHCKTPTKFTQIEIFCLKINHLATLTCVSQSSISKRFHHEIDRGEGTKFVQYFHQGHAND
jgi:hypothetical protein